MAVGRLWKFWTSCLSAHRCGSTPESVSVTLANLRTFHQRISFVTLSGTHRTIVECRARYCHVTLVLVPDIGCTRTGDAFGWRRFDFPTAVTSTGRVLGARQHESGITKVVTTARKGGSIADELAILGLRWKVRAFGGDALADLSRPFAETLASHVTITDHFKSRIATDLTLRAVVVTCDSAVGGLVRDPTARSAGRVQHALLGSPVSRRATHNAIDGSRIVSAQVRARGVADRRKFDCVLLRRGQNLKFPNREVGCRCEGPHALLRGSNKRFRR